MGVPQTKINEYEIVLKNCLSEIIVSVLSIIIGCNRATSGYFCLTIYIYYICIFISMCEKNAKNNIFDSSGNWNMLFVIFMLSFSYTIFTSQNKQGIRTMFACPPPPPCCLLAGVTWWGPCYNVDGCHTRRASHDDVIKCILVNENVLMLTMFLWYSSIGSDNGLAPIRRQGTI